MRPVEWVHVSLLVLSPLVLITGDEDIGVQGDGLRRTRPLVLENAAGVRGDELSKCLYVYLM